jgi:hypothetical protein
LEPVVLPLLATKETTGLTQYFPPLLQLEEVAVATTPLADQVKRVDQEAVRSTQAPALEHQIKVLRVVMDRGEPQPTLRPVAVVALERLELRGMLGQTLGMAGQV